MTIARTKTKGADVLGAPGCLDGPHYQDGVLPWGFRAEAGVSSSLLVSSLSSSMCKLCGLTGL